MYIGGKALQPHLEVDPLEKEMATHSNILAWNNSVNRKAWQATVYGVSKSQT